MCELPSLSLYIHIPWCIKKCPYCDFNSHTLRGELPDIEYVQHLLNDLEQDLPFISKRQIRTIFIGGGTPSLLSGKVIKILIEGIYARLSLISNPEITIEANPGTVEVNRFISYQEAGINRISIGIQSFNLQQLISIERVHSPDDALQAAYIASCLKLRSFNFDLMYGLPNQSLEDALEDIQKAISFNPFHLSWYQFTIEPNTLFSANPPKLPNDDLLWDIFEQGNYLLTRSGYKQYEISAYCKPGYYCEHNLNYWYFGDYIGIGCGAHGKLTQLDGRIFRTIKTRNPYSFMKGSYLFKRYELADSDKPFEFFVNRFRLLEKIPRSDFQFYTGMNEKVIRPNINQAISAGYLLETNNFWITTQKGRLFLNYLLEFFL
ncbi:radical SAM family heme chaperone HemW [Candidatus Pantoea carbekii]|uniref:Heme chaperone HemW n=1 Tax=Candidatus Pantoea carbekii TaxID=1235990 RepID=U3U5X9_9GAMM|nr:radical SAM family heme chaperone HemW [Candidatus Pantoea carbekii]AKC32559.1 oxygen-independent coproporphyrinogen III oxidaselike protein YggW [Candidatus Pantoea carbekii]BAO00290.1 YggW protein [Candidatus Pantoea carbekii]